MGTKRKRSSTGASRVNPAPTTPEASAAPRPRRREAQLCGACGEKVPVKSLSYHLALELDRLRTLDLPAEGHDTRTDDRGRRQAAVKARASLRGLAPHSRLSTLLRASPESALTLDSTLSLVRKNRLTRAARLREYGRAATAIVDVEERETQQCPICLVQVGGEEDVVRAHVDACLAYLAVRGHGGEDIEHGHGEGEGAEGAEYEWAGQRRVRTTALAGFAGTGFQVLNHSAGDTELELDVDGDEEAVYGDAQFFEDDVVGSVASEAEEDGEDGEGEEGEEAVERGGRGRTIRELVAAGSPEKRGWNGTRAVAEDLAGPAPTTTSCRICLDPYSTPLVSTACWHVHCQACWMRALGVSKLCPQCKCITQVGGLRRVYI